MKIFSAHMRIGGVELFHKYDYPDWMKEHYLSAVLKFFFAHFEKERLMFLKYSSNDEIKYAVLISRLGLQIWDPIGFYSSPKFAILIGIKSKNQFDPLFYFSVSQLDGTTRRNSPSWYSWRTTAKCSTITIFDSTTSISSSSWLSPDM